MRKLRAAFFLLLFAGIAAAQGSGNVFFGYSYYNTNLLGGRNGLSGWEGSFEGRVLPFVAVVADVSGDYGSLSSSSCSNGSLDCGRFVGNFSEHNLLFGPRVSFSAGNIRPFAEVLVGVAHMNFAVAGSENSFATAIGGGLDYKVAKILAWRFQGDYIRTSLLSNAANNVRISTGIVLRF